MQTAKADTIGNDAERPKQLTTPAKPAQTREIHPSPTRLESA
jgi:hypothetical protein